MDLSDDANISGLLQAYLNGTFDYSRNVVPILYPVFLWLHRGLRSFFTKIQAFQGGLSWDTPF